MTTRQIGQLTEIQATGGGNYLTQATPTNFHTFFTAKILVGNEKPEDFKEVTASQKSTIEAQDAKWVRPPQSFIDEWNIACEKYGKYNEQTGFFELNELYDITYPEALAIKREDVGLELYETYSTKALAHQLPVKVRTLIPRNANAWGGWRSSLFFYVYSENVRMYYNNRIDNVNSVNAGFVSNIFDRQYTIRKWLDVISITNSNVNNHNGFTFHFCTYKWTTQSQLRYFRFMNVNCNINVLECPYIELDTFFFLVKNRMPLTETKANPFTLTVHPDVMAKLTGDTTNAACAALTDEERTQWADLLTLAASKNIQFATA